MIRNRILGRLGHSPTPSLVKTKLREKKIPMSKTALWKETEKGGRERGGGDRERERGRGSASPIDLWGVKKLPSELSMAGSK